METEKSLSEIILAPALAIIVILVWFVVIMVQRVEMIEKRIENSVAYKCKLNAFGEIEEGICTGSGFNIHFVAYQF